MRGEEVETEWSEPRCSETFLRIHFIYLHSFEHTYALHISKTRLNQKENMLALAKNVLKQIAYIYTKLVI